MKVIDTYNAMVGAAVASFLMFWDLTGSCLQFFCYLMFSIGSPVGSNRKRPEKQVQKQVCGEL
mgnify:CR=1 FL=1